MKISFSVGLQKEHSQRLTAAIQSEHLQILQNHTLDELTAHDQAYPG